MSVLFILAGLVVATMSVPVDTLNNKIEFTELTTGLKQAQSIYATTAGDIYITETGRNRLLILNEQGIRRDSIGSRGSGIYGFDRPVGIHATNGMRIYVADAKNKRVQIFDRRRQFLGSLIAPNRSGFSPSFFEPVLVSINTLGEAFIYDNDSGHILKYNQQGRFENHIDLRMNDIALPIKSMAIQEEQLFLIDDAYPVIHKLNSGGGYNGFSSLKEVPVSLFVSERFLWVLSPAYIYTLDFRGRLLEQFPHTVQDGRLKGISVTGDYLYILTEKRLFRADKPLK